MVMDEMPAGLLDSAPLSGLLLRLVKRARRYRLGLVAVTSDVPGLLGARSMVRLACSAPSGSGADYWPGLSLLQNSGGKMLFRPDGADVDRVADAFDLHPVLGHQVSGWLRAGGGSVLGCPL